MMRWGLASLLVIAASAADQAVLAARCRQSADLILARQQNDELLFFDAAQTLRDGFAHTDLCPCELRDLYCERGYLEAATDQDDLAIGDFRLAMAIDEDRFCAPRPDWTTQPPTREGPFPPDEHRRSQKIRRLLRAASNDGLPFPPIALGVVAGPTDDGKVMQLRVELLDVLYVVSEISVSLFHDDEEETLVAKVGRTERFELRSPIPAQTGAWQRIRWSIKAFDSEGRLVARDGASYAPPNMPPA